MSTLQRTTLDVGLFLIRLMPGVVMVYHGGQKLWGWFGVEQPGLPGFIGYLDSMGVPWPTLSGYVSACTEFFGGLLLILGILPRLIAIPLAFNMFVAALVAKWLAAESFKFSVQDNGMEYPLLLAFVFLGLVFTGGGRLTLQYAIFGDLLGKRRKTAEPAD